MRRMICDVIFVVFVRGHGKCVCWRVVFRLPVYRWPKMDASLSLGVQSTRPDHEARWSFRMVRGWALGHGPRVLCTLAHFARGSWPNGFGQTFPWFLPFN